MTTWMGGARLTGATILAAALCMCGGCRDGVVHGMDESRANRVELLLDRAGIDAVKRKDGSGWTVDVPAARYTAALELIERSRVMYRDEPAPPEVGRGITSSADERDRARDRDTMWQLERSIERIPGVLEARAHVRGSSRARADGVVAPPSAAVLVALSPGTNLDPTIIRRLVAGGAGLALDRVEVISVSIPELREAAVSSDVRWSPRDSVESLGAWRLGAAVGLSLFAMYCVIAVVNRAIAPFRIRADAPLAPVQSTAEPRDIRPS